MTDVGTTFIELAAVLTVHTLDVEFRFRCHRGTTASPVAEWFDESFSKLDETNCNGS